MCGNIDLNCWNDASQLLCSCGIMSAIMAAVIMLYNLHTEKYFRNLVEYRMKMVNIEFDSGSFSRPESQANSSGANILLSEYSWTKWRDYPCRAIIGKLKNNLHLKSNGDYINLTIHHKFFW